LADQPHHRQQRHFERAVPLLVGHLVQLAPWRAAAVRHDHVDSSERLLRARDDRFHVLGLRHVGRHREHLGAGLGPHLLGGVLDVALGTRAHRDACAFSREAQRARLAHALARRRDERDLASQPQIHALLSPRAMSGARTSRSTDARHHQRTRVQRCLACLSLATLGSTRAGAIDQRCSACLSLATLGSTRAGAIDQRCSAYLSLTTLGSTRAGDIDLRCSAYLSLTTPGSTRAAAIDQRFPAYLSPTPHGPTPADTTDETSSACHPTD